MHKHYNGLKTALLLGGMSALILLVSSLFGRGALLIGLALALAVNAYAYFNSEKLALRAMRARPVSQAEQPAMYRIVRELATIGPPAGASALPQPDAWRRTRSPPAATRATPRSAARRASLSCSTSASCAPCSATSCPTCTTATS